MSTPSDQDALRTFDPIRILQERAEAAEASLTQCREVAGEMLGVLEQVLDDMGQSYCVCEGTKTYLATAIARARAAGIKEG